MNEFPPSYDRDHDAADGEKYRLRQAEDRVEEFYAWEADEEKARSEAATELSADGDPDDGPSNDLSDGCDAQGPEDQAARPLEAEDAETFLSRAFEEFEERLVELVSRIVVALENGRLDAGRRQAVCERIAVSGGHLVELADAVETDLGRIAR
jgi:hypothetical protein